MTQLNSLGDATALPEFHDAANWYGPAMANRDDWIVQLTPQELAELDSAVNQAIARRLDLVTMTADDFSLPLLAPTPRHLAKRTPAWQGICAVARLAE